MNFESIIDVINAVGIGKTIVISTIAFLFMVVRRGGIIHIRVGGGRNNRRRDDQSE